MTVLSAQILEMSRLLPVFRCQHEAHTCSHEYFFCNGISSYCVFQDCCGADLIYQLLQTSPAKDLHLQACRHFNGAYKMFDNALCANVEASLMSISSQKERQC